jgi:hypothetical protein
MEGKKPKVHVCVTELGPRPVEIHLAITLAATKNGRGRPRVKVSIEECPRVKRRAAAKPPASDADSRKA